MLAGKLHRKFGLKPSSTMAMASIRDACLAFADRRAAARKSAALISVRVIAIPAISPPRIDLTPSIHRMSPKGIPLVESAFSAVGIRRREACRPVTRRLDIIPHGIECGIPGCLFVQSQNKGTRWRLVKSCKGCPRKPTTRSLCPFDTSRL